MFTCLPFGLSTAPRVFTRVVREVGTYLRRRGVNICQYLDDWLVYAKSREETAHHIQLVIQVITRLGFVVNYKKSYLVPTQSPIYLGARLDLSKGRVMLSLARVNNMAACARILAEASVAPAVAWLKVLGLVASMVDLIPLCRFLEGNSDSPAGALQAKCSLSVQDGSYLRPDQGGTPLVVPTYQPDSGDGFFHPHRRVVSSRQTRHCRDGEAIG